MAFLFRLRSVEPTGGPLERRASGFNSKGVGLTETLLRFSHQEHLPIAIEYIDQVSMNIPISVSVRNKTIRQTLDSILLNGKGYAWTLRNGMIEITNRQASKRAEEQLNKIIPEFNIAEGSTLQRLHICCGGSCKSRSTRAFGSKA